MLVMNSNVGSVPMESNIHDTGHQLNKQSPGQINKGRVQLYMQLCIIHHCEQTSAFQEGNYVVNKDTKDTLCVDGDHEKRAFVEPKRANLSV